MLPPPSRSLPFIPPFSKVISPREKLPAIYPEAEFVAAGGLSSYGPSLPDLYRRAARECEGSYPIPIAVASTNAMTTAAIVLGMAIELSRRPTPAPDATVYVVSYPATS
jgi:hypothetical protein